MTGHSKRARFVLVALILLGLGCVLFYRITPRPLSPAEARLVGRWTENGTSAMVHAADRRFWTSDGQFVGRWWIDENGLNVQCWADEHYSSPLKDLLYWTRNRLTAPIDTWSIEFSEEDGRVTLVATDNSAVLNRMPNSRD